MSQAGYISLEPQPMEVFMTQRNILLLMLVFVIAMFGGLVFYDMKTNHRLEKILGNEKKDNWQWNDNWNPNAQVPSTPGPTTPSTPATPSTPSSQIVASDYKDAVKKSGELGMPVLVIFGADWCHWCTKMHDETLPHAKVKTVMKNYVFVDVDADKFPEVVRKFGVSGLPSYVITNCKEEKLKFGSGYKDGDGFAGWLDNPSMYRQPKADGVKPPEVKPPTTPPEEEQPDRRRPRRPRDIIDDEGTCPPGS